MTLIAAGRTPWNRKPAVEKGIDLIQSISTFKSPDVEAMPIA
jgi:hypothetical protein